jgi:hypothetical protein
MNFRYVSGLILVILSAILCHAENSFTFESAIGLGSEHMPFFSKWNGAVADGGLYYREFAVKGTYICTEYLSVSLTVGQIKDRYLGNLCIPSGAKNYFFYGSYYDRSREVFYVIPSVGLTMKEVRFNFGLILYKSQTESINITMYDYPFNGGHRLRPSVGIELGENSFYIFGRFFNSLPFYSGGGGLEIGLGCRYANSFEQKAYFSLASHFTGLGYKGEFKVYNTSGLIFGISLGWVNEDFQVSKNETMLTMGVKTIL